MGIILSLSGLYLRTKTQGEKGILLARILETQISNTNLK